MNRRILIGGLGGLLVLGIVTGWFFVRSAKKESVSPVIQQAHNISSLPSKNLKEYTDKAGFTFQHPQDVTATPREIKDSTTYADVELSSTAVSGKLTFKASDTKLSSLESWFKENKKELTGAKDITLGGITAKEVDSDDNIESVALDQGILFTIVVEGREQKAYWESVHATLLSSFAFTQAETSQGAGSDSSSPSSGDVIFEGEETVE